MLLAALGIFIHNYIFNKKAQEQSSAVLADMIMELKLNLPPLSEIPDLIISESSLERREKTRSSSPSIWSFVETDEFDTNAEENRDEEPRLDVAVSGYNPMPSYTTIGVISLPKLGVRLPVIGECTDALLGISCCRLSGIIDEKPIRLVIAGHNIASQFKGLDTYEVGDQIAFTTEDDITYYYVATEISSVHKSGGELVLEATGWDITLLTCMTDRSMRTMVRFVLLEQVQEQE